jgi:hypothetical protein
MCAAEQDEPPEFDQSAVPEKYRLSKERIAAIFEGLTTERLQKLIRLADKSKEDDSVTMKALKEMDPDFKGDFVNFKLKEAIVADLVSEMPDIPDEFPFLEIEPIERVVQRDGEDLKAMNLALTKVAKRLQLAIKYLLVAVEACDDSVGVTIMEATFRSLCLAGDAFSTLQVERFTTPSTRKSIAVATSSDQVPLVVQRARKEAFFRSGAGAKGAASHAPESGDDESVSDSDTSTRSWGRDRRQFAPRNRRPRRLRRMALEKPKYFAPRGRWMVPFRRGKSRAAPPSAPP